MTPYLALTARAADPPEPAAPLGGWRGLVAKLLGIPTITPEPYDDRGFWGGHLAPPPQSITRWFLDDLEAAIHAADTGNLRRAAQLCRALRRDGVLTGVLSTRTGGVVRLPKKFTGDPNVVAALEGADRKRGIFDRMFPRTELALLAADGIQLGVGVGELLPVKDRAFPVLRRLDPENLVYRWNEDAWYYMSLTGPLKITPGDGRWILHLPGGKEQPWTHGLWASLGRAYIAKEHANLNRENYAAKLANSARVAVSPAGAGEAQKQSWFRKVMAWGHNTVFGVTPGYDVKLIESNGVGYEVFSDIVSKSDEEIIIAIAGQVITTSGGSGFVNGDLYKSISTDLIQDTAESLADTINEQGIPPWVNVTYGGDALESAPILEWVVTPPTDLAAAANAVTAASGAMTAANAALEPYGKRVDAAVFTLRFDIPIEGDRDGDGRPDAEDDDQEDDEDVVPLVAARRAA